MRIDNYQQVSVVRHFQVPVYVYDRLSIFLFSSMFNCYFAISAVLVGTIYPIILKTAFRENCYRDLLANHYQELYVRPSCKVQNAPLTKLCPKCPQTSATSKQEIRLPLENQPVHLAYCFSPADTKIHTHLFVEIQEVICLINQEKL